MKKLKNNPIIKKIIQIFLISVLVFLLFTVFKSFADLAAKQKVIEEAKLYRQNLEYKKAELEDLLTADERDIIERYARMKYNYSFPGEIIYNDITKR